MFNSICKSPQLKKYGSTIYKEADNDSGTYTYYPIVVIGAGESGIAIGCRLKDELGFDQFQILERQSGIGGSWWINRYPGVACSNPAIFETYSFSTYDKHTSNPPTGSEILEHLQNLCHRCNITEKIKLNTDVRECQWLESEQVWELTISHVVNGAGDLTEPEREEMVKSTGHNSVHSFEEKIRARILVNAAGCTVEPKRLLNDIPGRESFKGEIFHSSRWRYDIDLTDKEIIVVGTGFSASQFVPLLIDNYGALSVTQLMRSPPWAVPLDLFSSNMNRRWNRFSPWLTKRMPGFGNFMRCCIAAKCETDWRQFGPSGCIEKQRKNVESDLLAHMKSTVSRRYHEILTPDHGFGCKRWVVDTAWFQTLNNPAVTLTTLPLSGIGETEITLGPGRLYPDPKLTTSKAPNHQVIIPADVIIVANEFDTGAWVYPLEVIGRGGKKFRNIYDEKMGSQIYMGVALDGFPNFFTVLSPNTLNGNASTSLASENTLNLCLQFIKPLLEEDFMKVEIKPDAELRWAKQSQNALEKIISKTGPCCSWYFDESGRSSVVYPHSQAWFTLSSIFPKWSDWNITYTSKGHVKNIMRMTFHSLIFAATLWGVVKMRTQKNPVFFIKNLFRLT